MSPWGSNPASKRRDKLYIIAEILEIAQEGILKTQLMYRANLSYAQVNDYLHFMLKNALLEKVSLNEKEVYKATKKGMIFLQSYHEITGLLRIETETLKCSWCQKEVSKEHRFCPFCGKALGIEETVVKIK